MNQTPIANPVDVEETRFIREYLVEKGIIVKKEEIIQAE